MIATESPRMARLRAVLAGQPGEQPFREVFGIVAGAEYPGLPAWRDENEREQATTESLRALEKWDVAFRKVPLNSRFVIDKGVVNSTVRLLRRIEFYRDDDANSDANLLAASPYMRDLRQVVVIRSCCNLLKPFTGSTEVRALRVVEVTNSSISDETWNRIALAPGFALLERLSLHDLDVWPAGLARALDGTPGRALRDLELWDVPQGRELLRDVLLPRKGIVSQLTSLALVRCYLRDEHADALARASDLRGLHTLDLRKNEISAKARKAILDAPQFRSTRVIFD